MTKPSVPSRDIVGLFVQKKAPPIPGWMWVGAVLVFVLAILAALFGG